MKIWKPIRQSLAILMTLAMLMSMVPAMGVSAATTDDVNVLGPVNGDIQGSGNVATSESTTPYASAIPLVDGGNFKFALRSAADESVSEMVLYFADTVNKRTDAKVTVAESGASYDYEMIIGDYDDTSKLYIEELKSRANCAADYIVRMVDNTKLYVVATTEYALQKALDYFLATYVEDDQGKIPAGLNYTHRATHGLAGYTIAGNSIADYTIRTERYPSLLVQRAAVALQEFFMENCGVVLRVEAMNSDGSGEVDKEIRVGPMNGAVNATRKGYNNFTVDNWTDNLTIESDGLIPGDYGYYEMTWSEDGDIQLNGGSVYAISAATVRFMQLLEDEMKAKSTDLTRDKIFTGDYESAFDYIYGRGYETVDFSLVDGYGLVYSDEFDYTGSNDKIYETVRSKWTLSQNTAVPTEPITNADGSVRDKENVTLTPAEKTDYGDNWWIAGSNGNNYLFEIAKAHKDEQVINVGGTEYTLYEGVRLASQEKWGFRYGIWETRIVMATNNGTSSSVWSHTKAPYDDELYWHEIDVYENYGQDVFVPCFHAFDNTLDEKTAIKAAAREEEPVNVWLYSGQYDEDIPGEGTAYQSKSWVTPAKNEQFYDTFHHLAVDWTYDYLRVALDGKVVSRIILGEDGPEFAPDSGVNKVEGVYENLFDAYRAGQTIKLSTGVGQRYYSKTNEAGEKPHDSPFTPDVLMDDISKYFEVQLVDYVRIYQTDNKLINYEPAKNDIRFADKFAFNETNLHRLGKFDGAQSFEDYAKGEVLAEGVVATEEAWLGGHTSAKVTTSGSAVKMPLVNALGFPFSVEKGSDYIVSLYVKVPETEGDYDLKYSLATEDGVVAATKTVATTEKGGWQKIEIIIDNCMHSGDLELTIGGSTAEAHTFYIDDVYVELQPERVAADESAMNFEKNYVGEILMQNEPGEGGSNNNEGSSVVISDKRAYTGDKSAMFVTDTHGASVRAQMNVLDASGNNVKLTKGKTYWLSFKVYIEKQYYNKYDTSDKAIFENAFNFYAACVPDDMVDTFFSSSNAVSNVVYSENGNIKNKKNASDTALEEHQKRNEWFEVSVKVETGEVEGNLRLGISHYAQSKFVAFVDDVRVTEGDPEVTVNFALNGGEGNSTPLTLKRGDSITAKMNKDGYTEPTRDHYIFRGWYTDPDFAEGTFINFNKTDDADENVVPVTATQPITLYARWQDTEHTYTDKCDAICNTCGLERDAAHVYDNDCDTTCNTCSETREAKHVYDNDCDVDCHVCGAVRTPAGHVYANDCDVTCDVCGDDDREVNAHVYDNDCDADCNQCGAVRAVGEHAYTNDCDTTCNTCGAIRAALHSYSSDLDNECDVCGSLRVLPAVPSEVLNSDTKVLFVGDAIAQGVKNGDQYRGWADWLVDEYGIEAVKRFSATDKLTGDLYNRFSANEGNDYVILQGGFRDMNDCDFNEETGEYSIPMGSFNPSKDPSTFEDRSTMAKGLDSYFYHATKDNPNARIGFIITYDMPNVGWTAGLREYPAQWWELAKEICAKWDIAYLDLYAPKYSEDLLQTDTETCLSQGYLLNDTGLDCITPYIAEWMATLVPYNMIGDHSGDVDDGSFDFSGDDVAASNAHAYRSACDAMCYVCGEVREIEHVYAADCVEICELCGERRRLAEDVEHVYDDATDAVCNICGDVRELDIHEHEYDNDCDEECNTCGDVRIVSGHKYDDDADASCNICGAIREVEVVECKHEYDNDCDADCNLCGETRTPADHVYDNDCDADCNVCGETRTPADHVYDNACDTDCNVCGATRETEHVYDNNCDADCNVCGAVRVAPHDYVSTCDNVCDSCGATRSTSGHDWTRTDGLGTDYTLFCNKCGYARGCKIANATLGLGSRVLMYFSVNVSNFNKRHLENPTIVVEFAGETVELTEKEEKNGYYIFEFNRINANQMATEVKATLHCTQLGVEKVSDVFTYSVQQYAVEMLGDAGSNVKLKTLLVDMLNYGAACQKFVDGIDADEDLVTAVLTDEWKAYASPTFDMSTLESCRDPGQGGVTDDGRYARWRNRTLGLGSAVYMLHVFDLKGTVEGYTFDFYIEGKPDRTWSYKYDNFKDADDYDEFSIKATGQAPAKQDEGYTNQYVLWFSGLYATEMDAPLCVTVKKDGVKVSNTYTYSVESYIVENYGTGTTLDDVLYTMMVYGNACKAFLAG